MTLTYCGNFIRQADPDRFLISLCMPRAYRPALWAVFAFNAEIAKTRSVVTETTTGLIRLTWWREAIEEIYNNETPRSHPVLEDLSRVIPKYNLDKDLFLKLLYAREFDLEDVPPASVDGLNLYAQETNAPLLRLGLQILEDTETDDIVNAIATLFGVTQVIRHVPHMLSLRQCMLPGDILAKHNLSAQKLFDFNQKEILPEIIKEVLEGLKENQNARSRLVRVHTSVAHMYLKRIRRAQYDVFDPKLSVQPPFMALRLWAMTR